MKSLSSAALVMCAALALWFIGCFLFVSSQSMTYPFHLEWMEGHMLDTVQRVVHGKPIYVEPSLEFIPYLYTPYYYYTVALFSLIFGVDFFAARLVSYLSILGVGTIIYLWIRREGGNRYHGIIAAGLLFSTYQLSGRWFDVARVDSLFLFLTLSGLYGFYFWRGWINAFVAALLLTIAFFTKQTALVIAFPLFVAMLFTDAKHSLITGAMLGVMVISGVGIMHILSHGWSSFYIFELPSAHHFDKRYIISFWTEYVFKQQLVVGLFSVICIFLLCKQNYKKGLCYFGLFSGLILGSYLMRINAWSYINVYIPLHMAYAIFAGLMLALIPQKSRLLRILACVAIAAHFSSLVYNPTKLIPSEESRQQGELFLQDLSTVEGDIFMPDLQFVQTRVGKKSYAYGMAAFDLLHTTLGRKSYIKDKLKMQFQNALKEGKFDAVVPGKVTRMEGMDGNYEFLRELYYPTEYLTGIIKPVRMQLYVARTVK